MAGAITQHLDWVQIITGAFFAFFAGLVYYLRREDKREGYPLWDVSPQGVPIEGFPAAPPVQFYKLMDGTQTTMPHRSEPSLMRGAPTDRHMGAPLVPIGDPMTAEIGPGAYPLRRDRPLIMEGHPQVLPMRVATDWKVAKGEPDPRGMRVVDAAHAAVGTVSDIWVDRSVKILRYLEVTLDDPAAGGTVLVPIYRADVRGKRRIIRLPRILLGHLVGAPRVQAPDEITAREEDRINAYFSAALMYGRAYTAGEPVARVMG